MMARPLRLAALTLGLLGSCVQVQAAEMPCATADEATGFTLRHLQSRLMVAALSCNQKEAYNSFMARFMTELAAGGRALIAYFDRTGQGAPALNRHVTELANAAGLRRAADPGAFCAATWQLFWDLQQQPEKLKEMAETNLIGTVTLPRSCAEAPPIQRVSKAKVPAKKTAAPQEAEAAVTR